MNKLSKIFLGIIFVLIILLVIVTSMYLKQRNLIYKYFGNYNFSVEDNTLTTNTESNK